MLLKMDLNTQIIILVIQERSQHTQIIMQAEKDRNHRHMLLRMDQNTQIIILVIQERSQHTQIIMQAEKDRNQHTMKHQKRSRRNQSGPVCSESAIFDIGAYVFTEMVINFLCA
jgi:hypothetical protein